MTHSTKSLVKQYRRKRFDGVIHCADALDLLRAQPSDSADVVFLDPPFNLSKKYGKLSDKRPTAEYELWLQGVVGESIRVLAKGGALYLYHLPSWAIRMVGTLERHLEFQHWIAVSMKNGFVRGNRLYPAHYALLYYTKGPAKTFTRPRLGPVKCRTCGTNLRDYGGYRKIMELKGVNLSDVWDDLSPVRHSKSKHRSANELPLALTDRVLAISGGEGLLLVDPFAGSGSMVVSAARAGMNFIAGDLVMDNCKLIAARVDALRPHIGRTNPNGPHRER